MNIDIQHIYKSKAFRNTLISISIAAVALLVFKAGIAVGYHKASFSYRFGEGYYRVFDGGRDRPRMMGFFDDELPGGHGALGRVVRVVLPSFVVSSPDNTERIITVGGDTIIRRWRDSASTSDIKVDDFIVTLGSPDDSGAVNAKFIRIMPPPASTTGPMDRMMYFR